MERGVRPGFMRPRWKIIPVFLVSLLVGAVGPIPNLLRKPLWYSFLGRISVVVVSGGCFHGIYLPSVWVYLSIRNTGSALTMIRAVHMTSV